LHLGRTGGPRRAHAQGQERDLEQHRVTKEDLVIHGREGREPEAGRQPSENTRFNVRACGAAANHYHPAAMKLFLAFVVWGAMAAALVKGLIMAVDAKPLLLGLGVLGFVLLVAKFGCLAHD